MSPRGKVETPYRSHLLLHETVDSAAPLTTVSSSTRAVRPNPHLDAASSLLRLQEEDGPNTSYGSAGDTSVQGLARTDASGWNKENVPIILPRAPGAAPDWDRPRGLCLKGIGRELKREDMLVLEGLITPLMEPARSRGCSCWIPTFPPEFRKLAFVKGGNWTGSASQADDLDSSEGPGPSTHVSHHPHEKSMDRQRAHRTL